MFKSRSALASYREGARQDVRAGAAAAWGAAGTGSGAIGTGSGAAGTGSGAAGAGSATVGAGSATVGGGSGTASAGLAEGGGRRAALRLGEVAGTSPLLHIGVYPGGAAPVAAAVLPVLGGPLPNSPVRADVAGSHVIMRIAPDQYWVLGGDSGLEARLRSAIPADAGSVTSLDASRAHLFIEGPAARAFLGQLVPIDLDPTVFPVHGFAQTGIHHVAGLLFRASEERYELLALRTFAAFTWEVLLDAARPLGYDIVLPEA